MANTINNLTTSNTFLQWLTSTQAVISRLNILTEGGNTQTFQANTNIDIANNVTIGGNLTVSGNITLDAIGFDDLIVAGGASIGTTLDVIGDTSLSNLTVSGNVATLNVTNNIEVGGANVYGDLYVGGNTVFGGNVTLDIVGFNDLNVSGKLTVSGNTSLSNTITDYGNFETANVTTLVGSANTLIFNTIASVNTDITAVSSYANSAFLEANTPSSIANSASIYANGAFIAANTAASDGLAFAIALG
jgi:hypothetical protein